MKKNEVKIAEQNNRFSIDISLNNLSWDNIRRLEFIFSEYIKIEEAGLKNWTEEEKKQWNVYERMHPAIEIRDLLRKSIKNIDPTIDFNFQIEIKKMTKYEWDQKYNKTAK